MPLQQILKNVSAEIADVSATVNSRSARVDGNIRRIERDELAHFPAVGIEESYRHTKLTKVARRLS